MNLPPDPFRDRVTTAAETALQRDGTVGPLELLQQMRWLNSVHVDAWRRGERDELESSFQGSPTKLARAFEFFLAWAKDRHLPSITKSYSRAGLKGAQSLRVTAEGEAERELFFRTHYAHADLPDAKLRRLTAKLNKAPDLVVIQIVAESIPCSECKEEMNRGGMLFMEKGQPLCLGCADLERLEFLPAGNTALSRRARKYSPLSAIVLQFNRARKRYERQGILVGEDAIAKAEAECLTDASERALQRARSAQRRESNDVRFIAEFTDAIRREFPACPTEEANAISRHAAARGSGRVGRSAAGRALDATAVILAVIAHIRHTHTNYDALLMEGVDRTDARAQVRSAIDELCARWRA